jgi:hypothetical protein
MDEEHMLKRRPSNLIVAAVLLTLGAWMVISVMQGAPLVPPKRGDAAVTINLSLAAILFVASYFFLQPYLERAMFGWLIDAVEAHRRRRAIAAAEKQERALDEAFQRATRSARVVEREEIGAGRNAQGGQT